MRSGEIQCKAALHWMIFVIYCHPGDDMKQLSYPLKFNVQINACLEKRKFFFSMPLFSAVHRSIFQYVQARKQCVFKPYETSFFIDEAGNVQLMQEVPFGK